MDLQHDFIALGIALGLGFLIGMQRERAGSRIAGSRTFPLIALFGAICGLLSQNLGSGIVIAGLVSVVGTFVVSHLGQRAADADHPGTTTEVAMLVVFGIGVLCELAPWEVGVALGGVVLVLLQAKEPLHTLARRIGETEARAVVRFAIVGMVLLPVMPAVTFGPYGVWNLRYIWMVVVLVVGIGLCAYVARRALGERKGALVGGLLGGMVSSTATTASVARELKDGMPLPSAVLVASLASAMVIPRQLIEVAVVAPSTLAQLAPPLLVVLVVFLLTVALAWRRAGAVATMAVPESKNPAALAPAFWFGVLFAAVLLAVAFAQRELGSAGLFAVAGLAGLTNVDAITLSSAGMVADGQIDAHSGWRLLVLASLSNLVFKVVLAGVLGGGRLARALALAWGPAAVVSALLLWLWP